MGISTKDRRSAGASFSFVDDKKNFRVEHYTNLLGSPDELLMISLINRYEQLILLFLLSEIYFNFVLAYLQPL